MTTIYLIRHAEAEGNLHRRVHGTYNSIITENGFRQIAALEERFRDIHVDAVWSSDLYRTMTTARAIYAPKGLELHTDPALREIDLGDWEDGTWGGVYRMDPEGMTAFTSSDPNWRAPNGESLGDVGQRIRDALERIAIAHPDQVVAVFCHGTAIRQTLANVLNVAPENWKTMGHSENTAVSCLTYEAGQFEVLFQSDSSHITEEISTLGRQGWWREDGQRYRDVNLWFRPIDWETEMGFYLAARRNAWETTHGLLVPFDGKPFLEEANEALAHSPWGVTVAMDDNERVGLLQLDPVRYSEDGAGYIAFCFVVPERRDQELDIQLIGQAVAHFRPLGRDKLRLRCAPYNKHAQHVYGRHGFVKIGEETGSRVPLDIMEKYIGYDR